MADAQKTIDLIFNGVDKTGAATMAALANTKSFTSSVKDITQPMADFTMGAVKLEASLLAAGAAMTIFAVKTAGDFDQSFRQITTLFDASAGDVAKFRAAILDYSSGSAKPLKDITDSLNAAIGSGVEWSKSLDLISVAEKLAVSTKADLKGTTEVLVSTLNSYGMQTSDAGKVSDLFFQIIKDGKIEMNDLAQSLSMVTPMAAASGVSLKEVGAAVATLTASGIQPATAIEYLRSAISNIIKPSKQAADLAAELGIQFDANALKSKGLAGVLNDVAKATGGSADKMSQLIGDVGGLVGAMVLTGPQAGKFKESLTAMGNSAGAVDEAFKKMSKSLDVSMAKVSNAFTGMLVAIGTPMLDEFGGIANAIAKIFQALGASVKEGALKDLVAYIDGLFGNLQKTLETVATNLPKALASADLSGFKNGIDAVVQAFAQLFGGIDITSVEGLVKAIQLAGAAFLGLSKFTAGVIESFGPLFDYMVKIGKETEGFNTNILQLAGSFGGIATQLNIIMPLFTGLLAVLTAKQAFTLVPSIAAMTVALPGLVALLAGPGSFAVALTALAYEAYKTQTALMALVEAQAKLRESQTQGEAINERAASSLERFAQTSGIAVKSINEADKLVSSGAVQWSTAANGWVKAGDALADVAQVASSAQADFRKLEISQQNMADVSGRAADGTQRLGICLDDTNKYALKAVPIFDALTGAITGYEQRLVKSAKGTIELGSATGKAAGDLTKIAEDTKKAEEAQQRWNEAIVKMSFDEKLKTIDQQTHLMTANIEATAKVQVAAFESITASVDSTSKSLDSLFGMLKDTSGTDWSSMRLIQTQIETENKRKTEALDLQKRMTEATIKQMEAQTTALQRGDGLIKVSGDGLQPHLEAFMWEILRTIQVRVNKDGLKMLLGT